MEPEYIRSAIGHERQPAYIRSRMFSAPYFKINLQLDPFRIKWMGLVYHLGKNRNACKIWYEK
jgi:hypothetical protein